MRALLEWLLEPDVWVQCHIVHGVQVRRADEAARRYRCFRLGLTPARTDWQIGTEASFRQFTTTLTSSQLMECTALLGCALALE